MGYWVYLVRCRDFTIYTGATTDLQRRIREHNMKPGKNNKYTTSRQPVKLLQAWEIASWSEALRLEAAIKKCSRFKKEKLITDKEEIYMLAQLRKLDFAIKSLSALPDTY
jgi:putative endonuclease